MISEKLSTDSRRMLQNGVPQFVGFCRCTPCRQRRGKALSAVRRGDRLYDAPRAGSAEAKAVCMAHLAKMRRMHPVQAAPRQRVTAQSRCTMQADAPRAGSAEAKLRRPGAARGGGHRCTPCRQRRGKARRICRSDCEICDAPRAGSAEAKQCDNCILYLI